MRVVSEWRSLGRPKVVWSALKFDGSFETSTILPCIKQPSKASKDSFHERSMQPTCGSPLRSPRNPWLTSSRFSTSRPSRKRLCFSFCYQSITTNAVNTTSIVGKIQQCILQYRDDGWEDTTLCASKPIRCYDGSHPS